MDSHDSGGLDRRTHERDSCGTRGEEPPDTLSTSEAERMAGQVLMRLGADHIRAEGLLTDNRDLLVEIRDLLRQLLAARAAREPREPEGCLGHVVAVLRAAGKRLTTTRVLEELAKAGHEWSETTVKHTLAAAVGAGVLVNDPESGPRGYGLAES